MKNIQTGINSTLDITEEKISELENKEIENIQNKNREKGLEKSEHTSESQRTILADLKYVKTWGKGGEGRKILTK